MTFIPSSLSSPFISVSTFPSHAHLLFERSDFFLCDLLLRDLHLSTKLFQEHKRGKTGVFAGFPSFRT